MTSKVVRKARVPRWLLREQGVSTQRQWRRRKRREWNAVLQAFDEFRNGCFYTPLSTTVYDRIETELKAVKESLSSGKWGD